MGSSQDREAVPQDFWEEEMADSELRAVLPQMPRTAAEADKSSDVGIESKNRMRMSQALLVPDAKVNDCS